MIAGRGLAPTGLLGRDPLGPGRRGAVAAEALAQLGDAHGRIGHERQGAELAGIEGLDVQHHDAGRGTADQRRRAGREIGEPGADREQDIGLGHERIRGARARDPDRAHRQRVFMRQARLAGLGLDHGDAVALGEGLEPVLGTRVEHAAARHDDGFRGTAQDRGRGREFVGIRGRAADPAQPLDEEALGVIVGLGLHVLAERQGHGPAIGRIGQHGQGPLQRRHELFGSGDAVEIARHGPEAVVGRDRAVAPILHLLEHGVGAPVGEDVAGNEQHRQPVHVGDAGRRHHVGGTGTDRGRAGHHAAAPAGLGEGHGRITHALLVMRPEGRQAVLRTLQGLAHPGDVAMAEDRPDAGEQRQRAAVDFRHLPAEVAHQRLRGGQAKRSHAVFPYFSFVPKVQCAGRSRLQLSTSVPNRSAI